MGFALLPDERILVISHQSGEVTLIADGVLKEDPVVTIPNLAISSERGLLGIAVDPDFPDANYIYLYYTSDAGYNRVSRFAVEGQLNDPLSLDLSIDLASEERLLELSDESQYHNAGTLRFGSDKTLYVSHGDDEKWKDWELPYMQDLTNLYGKILRINRDGSPAVDNPTFPSAPTGARPEIFAVGLRNPFRFSIDPKTDRLFIGDVGTNQREEFNLASGGENFGYPRHEGSIFFQEGAPLIDPEPTPPIYDYQYNSSARSAIALATYRQKNFPSDYSFPDEYDGVHFHADYFDDEIRYLRQTDEGLWESVAFGSGFRSSTDAAVGPDGSLYVIRYGGPLQRIYHENPSVSTEDPPVSDGFGLESNHPNPFEARTTISYRLPVSSTVRVEVFDVLGRRVATLVDAWQEAGSQTVSFGASGLPAGTYLCRLQAGGRTDAMPIVKN